MSEKDKNVVKEVAGSIAQVGVIAGAATLAIVTSHSRYHLAESAWLRAQR